MNLKTLLIVSSVGFLMACNGPMIKQPDVVVNEVTAMEEIRCGAEPKADKIHLRKVEPWAMQDRVDIWWVAFTPKHYENMGLNFNDMLIHLKQRKAQIEWFRTCIAFMFETKYPFTTTKFAHDAPHRQTGYDAVWQGLNKHFTGAP